MPGLLETLTEVRLGFQECPGLKSSLKLRFHLLYKVPLAWFTCKKKPSIFFPPTVQIFLQISHWNSSSYLTLNLSCLFFPNSLKVLRFFLNHIACHCIMVINDLCPECHSLAQVQLLQTAIKQRLFIFVLMELHEEGKGICLFCLSP